MNWQLILTTPEFWWTSVIVLALLLARQAVLWRRSGRRR
jgi:hypothetical protein